MLLQILAFVLIVSGKALAQSPDAGMVRIGEFEIDRYEYPNRIGAYPEVNVTWYEAQAKCASVGKRLCTEREWERACRGPRNYLYPYGNDFDQKKCNTGYREGDVWRHDRGTARIGHWSGCVSGYGVYDMSGNVWEWVDGWYSSKHRWRVVRGGSWFQSVNLARCDARYGYHLEPDYRLDLIGFRCCRDVGGSERRTTERSHVSFSELVPLTPWRGQTPPLSPGSGSFARSPLTSGEVRFGGPPGRASLLRGRDPTSRTGSGLSAFLGDRSEYSNTVGPSRERLGRSPFPVLSEDQHALLLLGHHVSRSHGVWCGGRVAPPENTQHVLEVKGARQASTRVH